MDDILHELGENVTYQDLYKIHTGHGLMSGNSDTDISSESGLSYDDDSKPLPYTYEELTQNLIPTEELPAKEFDDDCENMARPTYSSICSKSSEKKSSTCPIQEVPFSNNNNQPFTHSERVVRELSQLITTEYCFICEISGNKHYKQPSHYKNVIKWIETETKEIKQPVDIKLFFCQICNLALSGNENARKHYGESTHKEKAKSFCFSCLRVIEAIDMPNHCKSKKHLANIETTSSPESILVENIEKPSEQVTQKVPTISGTALNFQDKKEKQIPKPSPPLGNTNQKSTPLKVMSYACVLRGTTSNKNMTSHVKTTRTKKSEPSIPPATHASKEEPQLIRTHVLPTVVNPFAVILLEQLRRNYCYLCEESVNKERGCHYKKRKHYQNLREWIEREGILFGFNMSNIHSVMCFACHYIFPTYTLAVNHYRTKEHEKMAQFYCDVCMYHDNSDIHKEHKKMPKEPRDPKDMYKEKDILAHELKLAERDAGAFIAIKLKDLLPGTYCFLCQTMNSTVHELTKVHLRNVRRWLEIMIQNTGVKLNRRFIFCEDCSIVLTGTDESHYHYESKIHIYNQQTYCPVCMFRASPEDVMQHLNSVEHNTNLEALLLLTMPVAQTVPNVTDKIVNGCENDNTSVKKEKQKEPELNAEVEKPNLKIETQSQQHATDSEMPKKLSDHQNMNLIHLGLQLGRFSTEKLLIENNKHADICKDILAGYWQLVTMLEIVPLDVCSNYLKKFNKDIEGIYKEYLNNLNKNKKVEIDLIDNENVQNIQPNETISENNNVKDPDVLENECLCDGLDLQMTKITSILTKCLTRKISHSSLNIIRRLTVLVRNFRRALEELYVQDNGLNLKNIFVFSSECYTSSVPYLEENFNTLGIDYEVCKFSLIKEMEQLSTFVKNQTVLKPDILLDCLLEFRKGLLIEVNYITACPDEEKIWNDYFYVADDEVADDKVIMQVTTDKTSPTTVDKNNVDDSQTSNTEDPKEMECDQCSSYDSETDQDSDASFGSTVECLCDGWCNEKIKN